MPEEEYGDPRNNSTAIHTTQETRTERRTRRLEQLRRIMDETGINDPRTALWKVLRKDIKIENQKEQITRLTSESNHDQLTGLPLRAVYDADLAHVVSRLREGKGHAAVVARFDLDRFSWVNEIIGAHEFGDLYLQQVAATLQTNVRRGKDTPYRVGGDEFAILLSDTFDLGQAKLVTDRIFRSLNGTLIGPTLDNLAKSTRQIGSGKYAGQPQRSIAFREIAHGLLEVTLPVSDKRRAFLTAYKGTPSQKIEFLRKIDAITVANPDIFRDMTGERELPEDRYREFAAIIAPAFSDLTVTMGAVFIDGSADDNPQRYDTLADKLTIAAKDRGEHGTLQFVSA